MLGTKAKEEAISRAVASKAICGLVRRNRLSGSTLAVS